MSRPMLELVLNDWVTDTNETLWASNSFNELCEVGERAGQAVDLVNQHNIDPTSANITSSCCSAGRSSEAPENAPSS